MIAHVAGVPVEELLPTLMSGIGAGIVVKLTWLRSRMRRHRRWERAGPTAP